MSLDDAVNDARLVELQPGDVLVLETGQAITAEQAVSIKDKLRAYPAFSEHEVVVLAGIHFTAIRPSAG